MLMGLGVVDEQVVCALVSAVGREPSDSVSSALTRVRGFAVPALVSRLSASDLHVRCSAAELLERLGRANQRVVEQLVFAMREVLLNRRAGAAMPRRPVACKA